MRILRRVYTLKSYRLYMAIGVLLICIGSGAAMLARNRASGPTVVVRSSKAAEHGRAPLPSAAPGSSDSYDRAILGDKPVAYWAMGAGSSSEADLTGNGNTGVYQGGLPTAASMPNGDPAALFQTEGQYLTIPSNVTFSISDTHALTWEGWIDPSTLQFTHASSTGYVEWLGKCQDSAPSCEWAARMYSASTPQGRCSRLSAYIFNSSAGLGSGAFWQPTCGLFNPNHWLYVVGEYTTDVTPKGCDPAYPGAINIWVNGIGWSQSDHTPTGCMSQYKVVPKAGNSPLNIGTVSRDTWFQGAIGKVAIYDHLLTQQQIDAHYMAMTHLSPQGNCGKTCTATLP